MKIKEIRKQNNGLKGEIIIPPDKSISHRALMLASLTKGIVTVENFSQGADCLSTLGVIKDLGIQAEFKTAKTLIIDSTTGFSKPQKPLYCGNSGTTMRLMSGILAGQTFDSVLTGDESLSKRPMGRVIKPLELMGTKIISNDNKAPLKIFGRHLNGIDYISELASAQVKSCVLIAGLHALGKTSFTEPYLSRNHTERMLEYLGADIKKKMGNGKDNYSTVIIEQSMLQSKPIVIPGDLSSAAFFIVAGLIIPDSEIIIKNVGLNSTRTGILDVIKKMGGDIDILEKNVISNEEVGDLKIKYSDLKACIIEGDMIPRLIDELPVIAVLATQAKGKTVIKNAQDLRNKESDRINAIVSELKKIGAKIKETKDGFIVEGKTKLKGNIEVETFHDHRLAMSLYVAGLICDNPILINGFEWINISFPEFEELIFKVSG